MFGYRLSCHVEVFRNGVRCHRLQCDECNDGSSCWICYCLKNISSHFVIYSLRNQLVVNIYETLWFRNIFFNFLAIKIKDRIFNINFLIAKPQFLLPYQSPPAKVCIVSVNLLNHNLSFFFTNFRNTGRSFRFATFPSKLVAIKIDNFRIVFLFFELTLDVSQCGFDVLANDFFHVNKQQSNVLGPIHPTMIIPCQLGFMLVNGLKREYGSSCKLVGMQKPQFYLDAFILNQTGVFPFTGPCLFTLALEEQDGAWFPVRLSFYFRSHIQVKLQPVVILFLVLMEAQVVIYIFH